MITVESCICLSVISFSFRFCPRFNSLTLHHSSFPKGDKHYSRPFWAKASHSAYNRCKKNLPNMMFCAMLLLGHSSSQTALAKT